MTAQRRATSTLDLAEMAQRMIEAAAAVTTGQLRLSDPVEVHARLAQGDSIVISHFRHELAHQIGAALLWMDPHVVAVYEDQGYGDVSLSAPLRIIVHVDYETAALRSLVAALGEALGQVRLDAFVPPSGTLFDALIVDGRSARLLRGESRGHYQEPKLIASRESLFTSKASA